MNSGEVAGSLPGAVGSFDCQAICNTAALQPQMNQGSMGRLEGMNKKYFEYGTKL